MEFNYEQYKKACLAFPLILAIVCIFVIIAITLFFLLTLRRQQFKSEMVARYLLVLAIHLFFAIVQIGRLSYGGIYLMHEKEEHAIVISGEIEYIRNLSRFSFPEISSEYGYGEVSGVEIQVNGICCSMPTRATFEIGDYVTVKYLPKSGYVLVIDKTGDKTGDGLREPW